jgi:hypothetical protein
MQQQIRCYLTFKHDEGQGEVLYEVRAFQVFGMLIPFAAFELHLLTGNCHCYLMIF